MATAKPLSWNEIRDRAVTFAARWAGETDERAEAQTFWNEWFAIFGLDRRRVAQFEKKATRTSTGGRGRIDAFWEGQIAVEHKSAGLSLERAETQALDYLDSLRNVAQPRLVITSDFGHFRVLDLVAGTTVEFPLADLPKHLGRFGFLAGYETRSFKAEDEVNIKAAEMMGGVYDALAESGYVGHELKVFLVRLMFLMFADDTGVWEKGLFSEFLETRTADDGSDTGALISNLFQTLDKPEDARSPHLDALVARFPYVNGGLFREHIDIPNFSRGLRTQLIDCSAFDWAAISPAIFGSMFQSVMDADARHALGAHYTPEKSILKVIQPLFLDDLRGELAAAGRNARKLRALQDKLAAITCFDPAAGCGNFLIIAYRELRRLEFDILVRLEELEGGAQQHLSVDIISGLSKVNVDQFYAIEIEEFPARIAETALYLVDHLENMRLSQHFGQYFARIPLRAEAHIHQGNAIALDWEAVLPAAGCSYLLGNPPFLGMALLSDAQREDNRVAFAPITWATRTGRLDYVACWYAKALRYMKGTTIRAALVSTNSITQGEQARTLGPMLADAGFAIDFAHRTFKWTSEGKGKAAVHVVVIGFSHGGLARAKTIYDYPTPTSEPKVTAARDINIYLADSPVTAIAKHHLPLGPVPKLTEGNRPQDGGGLLVSPEERDDLIANDPVAAKYLRRLVGAYDMLRDEYRYCLWLVGADPSDIANSPELSARMRTVAAARQDSPTESARQKATTPSLFLAIRQPATAWLCVPRHSSESRRYVPMRFFAAEDIAHDSTLTLAGADTYLFGVLHSLMFNTWLRSVGGRLKSDMRVSPDLVYNSFPFPDRTPRVEGAVAAAGLGVLETRAQFTAPLVVLYDPNTMPPALAGAHRVLDRAVDKAFGLTNPTDAARLAELFKRYRQRSGA